ncbi:MAG: energy transducer TonB [Polyangiaceae bacterium]|nr:energy transducer TonB [Polyangiaceae bacterium]
MNVLPRRKKRRSAVYMVSVGFHLLMGAAIAFIPKEKLEEVMAIAFTEAPKPRPAAERPKTEQQDKPRPARRGPARGGARPVAAEVATEGKSDGPAFTNLGIALDASSLGGIAVRAAPAAVPVKAVAPPPRVERPKVLVAAPDRRCTEPVVKGRPDKVVTADYTVQAKVAGIEGRVRLRLMIDETGRVTDAAVLSGLGYGLDEAALRAARQMHFRPSTQCGKPVATPYILSLRFVLGS